MKALESFVGSASILLFGFVTIPLAGWLVGVSMSASQGASMSLLFFFGRWALLYCIRGIFEGLGASGSVSLEDANCSCTAACRDHQGSKSLIQL